MKNLCPNSSQDELMVEGVEKSGMKAVTRNELTVYTKEDIINLRCEIVETGRS